MPAPVRVAVTGAAGQIGYSLLFRIASGAMLGPESARHPAAARDHAGARRRSRGVAMELEDCAFPLLDGRRADRRRRTPRSATSNFALLVGAMPRKAGMERADLLSANGDIFTGQGKALSDSAASDVKVLVVGNPANTNCLIAHEQRAGPRPDAASRR